MRLKQGRVVRACGSLTRCLDLCRDGDSYRAGETVEVVEGGEVLVGGLKGVSCRVEKLADVADTPVDGEWCDAEEAGDGDLRESEPVVEESGQESVGEGEHGAAAGAGCLAVCSAVLPAGLHGER
jgi:hypothetical protein